MTLRLCSLVLLLSIFSLACQKETIHKSSEKILYKVTLSDPSGLEYYNYRDPLLSVICPAYYGNMGINGLRYLTTHLEVSPGATVEGYREGIAYDYAQPKNLRVIAEDGSDSIYTIRIGYIEGGLYKDDTFVSPMKMNTAMVWAAKENLTPHTKFTLAAGDATGPVSFGLDIVQDWNMPDSITAPVTFTDFDARFVHASTFLHTIQSTLTITEFNRKTRQVSGEWDVQFYQTPDMPYNRSKGQFRNFPLN